MKITYKEILADAGGTKIVKMKLYAPDIAKNVRPGQFVVVMVKEEGERIPLTVVEAGGEDITLIFQEAGFSTTLLAGLEKGESVYALVGPLGRATEIKDYGKVIVTGGGVGIAEIYPVIRGLKQKSNIVHTVIGARTKDLLFLQDELKQISDELFVATDDGSTGVKGFTTQIVEELLQKDKYDLVYTVGPVPMMEKIADITKRFQIKTLASLNALMLDATGMCGCCRVTIGTQVKFACVDGPEFNAHLVDWKELENRSRMYEDKEKHICRLKNT